MMSISNRAARQEILGALRKAAVQEGEALTLERFCGLSGVSRNAVYRHFGTWGNLRREAGMSVRGGWPLARRYDRTDILRRACSLMLELGPTLTFREFERRTGITRRAVEVHFGTWSHLRRELGLRGPATRPKLFDEEMMVAAVRRLLRQLRRMPTAREIDQFCPFSWSTLMRHFGRRRNLLLRLLRERDREPGRENLRDHNKPDDMMTTSRPVLSNSRRC